MLLSVAKGRFLSVIETGYRPKVKLNPDAAGPSVAWSRRLADIWLRRHNRPLTVWPERQVGRASV